MQPDQGGCCLLFVNDETILFCFVLFFDIIYLILFSNQHFKMNVNNGLFQIITAFIWDTEFETFTLNPLEFQLFSNIAHAIPPIEGARIANFLTLDHVCLFFSFRSVGIPDFFVEIVWNSMQEAFANSPWQYQTFLSTVLEFHHFL